MTDTEKLVSDFRRLINKPFAGMDEWITQQDLEEIKFSLRNREKIINDAKI